MIFNMQGKGKDKNLLPENIKDGVEIDGVIGKFAGDDAGNASGYKDISSESIALPSTMTLPENWKMLFIQGIVQVHQVEKNI